MSIRIRKRTGEVFDLSADYVIEAVRTSPAFTAKGSQTVPVSFPATAHNRLLTGHPDRADVDVRPATRVSVVVESESCQQAGILAVSAASPKTFSGSVGWDESEMYAEMNKTLLPDIPGLPVYDPGQPGLDARLTALIGRMYSVMNELIATDYAVFPVIVKQDTFGDDDRLYSEVLNETFQSTVQEIGFAADAKGDIGGFRAKADRVIPRIVDGQPVMFEVPRLYGISPFIRVWRILELVFGHYGFTLENNPFREHAQLSRMVALNSTMDALITGRLYYRDMMPDISEEDFLDALKKRFGLLFFVNSNTRSVRFEFMRDIFSPDRRDGIDLTRYKTAEPSLTYRENRQLKLVPNNEIEGAAPKYETYEEFLDMFGHQFHEKFGNDGPTKHTLLFKAFERRYYAVHPLFLTTETLLTGDFFGWDKKDNLAYEEMKFTDLSLPFHAYSAGDHGMPWNLLLYPFGYRHNHSDVSVNGRNVDGEKPKAWLAFAFSWGKSDVVGRIPYFYNYAYASQDNRDANGRFIPDAYGNKHEFSLLIQHVDGIFNRFWKPYDAWLRHSGHEANHTLKMSETELSGISPWRKIMIGNQLYVMEELRYQMGKSVKPAELKARTIRLYSPCNPESEQEIATYAPQLYYWRPVVVKDPDIEVNGLVYGHRYTVNGYPSDDFDARKMLIRKPPTAAQYAAGETLVFRYTYELCWQANGIGQSRDVEMTVTFYPELIP